MSGIGNGSGSGSGSGSGNGSGNGSGSGNGYGSAPDSGGSDPAPARLSSGGDPGELVVASDRAEHAALAGELMAQAMWTAIRERGHCRVAVSGGSTPAEAYRYIAGLRLPWDKIEWFWVDERAVPPDHARSNYAAARRDLGLDRPEIPPHLVHRMEAEASDLGAAADRYERLLRLSFGVASAVAFDVMSLGIGDDGHTASLFPGTGSVAVADRLVLPVAEHRDLEARLTLTAPVLCEARLVVMLARGENKRAVVAAARGMGSEDEVPARVLQRARGRVIWVLDKEAAGAV
ncbi:MAG: 6-phosphogluconolactonase [Polyangiaceae bacterium]|nr:6-phosphogluconolactonase [Polyangiaceae bacterium]